MSDIFLCYSRSDKAVADLLADRLHAEDWTVFRDTQTRIGKRWHKVIEQELHAAAAVVVLWSANSRESDYVLEEAAYGKRKEILFPAFIEHVEYPYGFSRIQTADLVGWRGELDHPGLAQLLDSLREHLGGRPTSPAAGTGLEQPESTPPATDRQTMRPNADERRPPNQPRPAPARRKRSPSNLSGASRKKSVKSKPKPASGEMPAAEGVPPSTSDSRQGEGSQTKSHTAAGVEDKIAKLLAEIDNLGTTPPRRWEIGDRLDALGDPRRGVGVIEIDAPVDEEAPPKQTPPKQKPKKSEAASDIERLQAEIDDPKTVPPRRLEIGDELDRPGDLRRGVGLNREGLPDIFWIKIPGGPFLYQDGQRRKLPDFWISRYPVTNAQFQAFVESGAYRRKRGLLNRMREMLNLNKFEWVDPGWWRGLAEPVPDASRWPQRNRPRTNVDWYEAVAFTRWLTERLGLAEGAVRLPTEFEWEKAARGPKGLIYPWGDEYRSGFANVDETYQKDGPWYLEQTTAVGLYPHGRSPYGVEDMAGTVWEWCLNKYAHAETITADTSGDERALRGGSWGAPPGNARADYRSRYLPDSRYERYGFRVVSAVPMTNS